MASQLSAFLAELNPAAGGAERRRVFRISSVYAGVAFVIIPVVDGTLKLIGIPE